MLVRRIFKKSQVSVETSLIPMFSLILVFGVIFLGILNVVEMLNEDFKFEQAFLTRDLATLVDAVHASPSNIKVVYPGPTFWFNYRIDDGYISVADPTSHSPNISYPFTQDFSIHIRSKEPFPSGLEGFKKEDHGVKPIISKIGKEIYFSDEPLNINKLSCPPSEDIIGSRGILPLIVDDLASIKEEITKPKDPYAVIEPYAVIVALKVKNSDSGIRAFIPMKTSKFNENKKLACLILNQMIDNIEGISGIAVIPKEQLHKHLGIEKNIDLVVLIEINENLISTNKATEALINSINNGIREYDS